MSKFIDLTGVQPDARDLERLRRHADEISAMAHDPEVAPGDSTREAALFAALHLLRAEIERLEKMLQGQAPVSERARKLAADMEAAGRRLAPGVPAPGQPHPLLLQLAEVYTALRRLKANDAMEAHKRLVREVAIVLGLGVDPPER